MEAIPVSLEHARNYPYGPYPGGCLTTWTSVDLQGYVGRLSLACLARVCTHRRLLCVRVCRWHRLPMRA